MKNFVLFIILLLAGVNCFAVEEGRGEYRKNCMKCHGIGAKGAFMATQDGWKKWFDNGAKKLADKHSKTEAKSYFESDGFKVNAKNIFEFLHEYASDSGNSITGCNPENPF